MMSDNVNLLEIFLELLLMIFQREPTSYDEMNKITDNEKLLSKSL